MLDLHELQQLTKGLSLLQEKNMTACLGPDTEGRVQENMVPKLSHRSVPTDLQTGGGQCLTTSLQCRAHLYHPGASLVVDNPAFSCNAVSSDDQWM